MASTDLIQQTVNDLVQQRSKECRRLAAAARNAGDKMFWLGLVERWQTLGSRTGRQYCQRHGPLVGHSQNIAPAGEERQPGLSPGPTKRRRPLSQPRRLR
jgi:hypothetical protein